MDVFATVPANNSSSTSNTRRRRKRPDDCSDRVYDFCGTTVDAEDAYIADTSRESYDGANVVGETDGANEVGELVGASVVGDTDGADVVGDTNGIHHVIDNKTKSNNVEVDLIGIVIIGIGIWDLIGICYIHSCLLH